MGYTNELGLEDAGAASVLNRFRDLVERRAGQTKWSRPLIAVAVSNLVEEFQSKVLPNFQGVVVAVSNNQHEPDDDGEDAQRGGRGRGRDDSYVELRVVPEGRETEFKGAATGSDASARIKNGWMSFTMSVSFLFHQGYRVGCPDPIGIEFIVWLPGTTLRQSSSPRSIRSSFVCPRCSLEDLPRYTLSLPLPLTLVRHRGGQSVSLMLTI